MLYFNKELQALWPWSVHHRLSNQVRPLSLDFFSGRFKSQTCNNDTFLSTLEADAPIKSSRICSCPCPATPEIKDQMTFIDQLFRCYRQRWNADIWKAYKEAWRSVKQLLKNAECDHICPEAQSHKDNSESLWKIINTCIPSNEKETLVHSRH